MTNIKERRPAVKRRIVAILVAIAVAAGIIFKGSVVDFVNKIFNALNAANF